MIQITYTCDKFWKKQVLFQKEHPDMIGEKSIYF